MTERVLLVHYHEIGLKGRNKSSFEERLRANLESALESLLTDRVRRAPSRLVVPVPAEAGSADRDVLIERVRRVPGVSYVADAVWTGQTDDELSSAAELVVREQGEFATFRVTARRSATNHPVPSMEMNAAIGQRLREATGAPVDLSNPDVTCWVEVVQRGAFVFARRVDGVGGLPVGTAGKVIALLSSGIDSPVATWRVMKRGAVIVAVHFSGEPQTDDATARTVEDIGTVLERSGGLGRLYIVPFGDVQKEIALGAPPDLRVILYRRMMVRIAEVIAGIEGAKALVTGESLGQVASQTLENIGAVDAVATLPVLRPLIGSDKVEIVDTARAIGTYDLSIQAGEDCCTLFMPRTPATHATLEEAAAGESELDVPALVDMALAGVRTRDYRCRWYRPPKPRR